MAKNVKSTVIGGQMTEIEMTVDTERDIKIYRDLIKNYVPKCPECNQDLCPTDDDLKLFISDPLISCFGMDLGVAKTVCDKCGAEVTVNIDGDTTLDMSAFESVVSYLHDLRAEYQKRLDAHRAKTGGSSK